MKKIITLLMTLVLAGWSFNAMAFYCETRTTRINRVGGSANVYVNIEPRLNAGQNVVVDLSNEIKCRNENPTYTADFLKLKQGSTFSGVMSNFTGTIKYQGRSYRFPLTTDTEDMTFGSVITTALPLSLLITPTNNASGIVIPAGSLIASLIMEQHNSDGDSGYTTYTWNIYTNNSTVVPTGGCDVSSRDITVMLPDYPASTKIPLTVRCAKNQSLRYYISGTTEDSSNSIFINTATNSPAGGIGIQFTSNGNVITANSPIMLGSVGTSPVDIGLTANYARTKNELTAGNVQSIVGVTFEYP